MEFARLVSLYFLSTDQLHMPDYLPPELIINYTLQVKTLQNASLDLIHFALFLRYVSQLPIREVPGALFPRKNQPRREVIHSLLSSADAKNKWSNNSISR